MIEMDEFKEVLAKLIDVLEKEKEALISNNNEDIFDLIEEKNNFINTLKDFKGLDIKESKEIMSLIGEINELQEVNLILTKQALNYQNSFINAINKQVENMPDTYSSNGSKKRESSISLVDQSV